MMPREIWSIHDIKVLLHHYTSTEPWPLGITNAYLETRRRLKECDLLTEDLTTTDRGAALIRMWCSQPVGLGELLADALDASLEDWFAFDFRRAR